MAVAASAVLPAVVLAVFVPVGAAGDAVGGCHRVADLADAVPDGIAVREGVFTLPALEGYPPFLAVRRPHRLADGLRVPGPVHPVAGQAGQALVRVLVVTVVAERVSPERHAQGPGCGRGVNDPAPRGRP